MDPIQIEKLQAMAKYKNTHFHFLRRLIKCTLSVILLGLFLSSPLWLPPLYSCINSFVFVSVPKAVGYVSRPKILFIISNIIVFILVGESRLLGSSNSTPDLYDEYVERKKSYNEKLSLPAAPEKEVLSYEEKNVIETSLVHARSKEDLEKDEEEKEDGDEEEEVEDLGEEEEQEAEECGLPVDELNKRVEDFIARVNQQRRLEARMLIFSG